MLSYSQRARLVRLLRAWALNLRTIVLCVVSFRASDTKMRRHSSQSRMMSLDLFNAQRKPFLFGFWSLTLSLGRSPTSLLRSMSRYTPSISPPKTPAPI